jgi:hypothetical protein
MKHLLPALFLLITAAPLFANDDDSDGAVIPSYQELVHEGYGPRHEYAEDRMADYYVALNYGLHAAPIPTQAYYGRGYVVYYGYQIQPMVAGQENTTYAFGHPVSYYRQLLPKGVDQSNINQVAVEVRQNSFSQPGDYVAQRHYYRTTTVTSVKPTARPAFKTQALPNAAPASNTLPAIGEKPSH